MQGRVCQLLSIIRENNTTKAEAHTEVVCAENELELLLRVACPPYNNMCKQIKTLECKERSLTYCGSDYFWAKREITIAKDDLKKWLIKDICEDYS
jgi:hypothetical protein